MLEAFVGPCPAAHVAHRIGSKEENRLDNFHWATHGEASTKRVKPLTVADVREIRALAERGILQSQIARQLGLGSSAVSKIVCRRHWKHVD
jgi:DNA-binding MarR family transcriptional regulator